MYWLYTWCTRELFNRLGCTPICRDTLINHMFRNTFPWGHCPPATTVEFESQAESLHSSLCFSPPYTNLLCNQWSKVGTRKYMYNLLQFSHGNKSGCQCTDQFYGEFCERRKGSLCPHGYYDSTCNKLCACDVEGSEEEICDWRTGECLCKVLVIIIMCWCAVHCSTGVPHTL